MAGAILYVKPQMPPVSSTFGAGESSAGGTSRAIPGHRTLGAHYRPADGIPVGGAEIMAGADEVVEGEGVVEQAARIRESSVTIKTSGG